MMASTSRQTHEPLTSGKDQESKINTREPGANFSVRSTKSGGDRMPENKKKPGFSNNPNPCTPGNVSVEDVRAEPSKRMLSPDIETPKKRHRVTTATSKLSDVLVDALRDKRGRRKASNDQESPKRRHMVGGQTKTPTTDTSKPEEGSVEEVKAGQRKSSSGEETFRKECSSSSSEEEIENTIPKEHTSIADFVAKYRELNLLGEGGFGSVYAGIRIADFLPVAIKHIPSPVEELEVNVFGIPLEVALMQKVSGGAESVGKSAAVSLLDWYYLNTELILVMERPVPSMDLYNYISERGRAFEEHEAKIFLAQLVEAAVEMHCKGVFHRDLKVENVLVDVSSTVPRVRIIDFGCGCFVQKKSHRDFSGTSALAPPEWHIRRKYKAAPTTVWQLGALLYCLLHGSVFNTVLFINGKIPINKMLSLGCQDFLYLCLTINPKERGTLKQLQLHPWLK